MIKIQTARIEQYNLKGDENLWVYNGLDCCVTHEIYGVLRSDVEKNVKHTYDFEMAMLGPALTMARRGLAVDHKKIQELKDHFEPLGDRYRYILDELVAPFYDDPKQVFNPNSPMQIIDLLYDRMAVPKQLKFEKGKQKISTDSDTLRNVMGSYFRAHYICKIILAIRDVEKRLSVLNSKLSEKNRLRTSYNVAGTDTGRWSSSENALREGANLQNMTDTLRVIVVPDPGYKLFYADLEQAESRTVAYLSGDENYIAACEGGDLHSTVVQMIWPDMGWTGDLGKDRKIANQHYFKQFTYRDICKRAGHGTNYVLQPPSLARHLQIPLRTATKFQLDYFGGEIGVRKLGDWHKQDPDAGFDRLIDMGEREGQLVYIRGAFPGIREWHKTTLDKLRETGTLTTPFKRRRMFWGRLDDATTDRQAIAYVPQSTIGDLLNVALYKIWDELEPEGVKVLGQVHDAVLGQFPDVGSDDYYKVEIIKRMENPLKVGDRMMLIPSDIETGYNWMHRSKDNEKGLSK
jgi:DNA polymerase I-like protein with 3'-5' exonuclease and polymerase domains